MTDLPDLAQQALTHLRPRPDSPTGVAIAVAGRRLAGWSGDAPLRMGPAMHGALMSAVAIGLCDRGLLSPGTTVRECVPIFDIPPDVDRTTCIDELLAVLGTANRTSLGGGAHATRDLAIRMMERVVGAACGEPLGDVADRIVLQPHSMAATRPVVGPDGTTQGWTSTLQDLHCLVAGPAWAGLAQWDVLQRHQPSGRVGLAAAAGHPGGWSYPAHGISVAVLGADDLVLAVLDDLVR